MPVDVQLEVRRRYYAAISWMDDLVGGVTAAVEQLGFADNTVIIFHAGDPPPICQVARLHSNPFLKPH